MDETFEIWFKIVEYRKKLDIDGRVLAMSW